MSRRLAAGLQLIESIGSRACLDLDTPGRPASAEPTRATVIAALVLLAIVAGSIAVLMWGCTSVASCYTGTGSRWC